jgi:hypothetical protein
MYYDNEPEIDEEDWSVVQCEDEEIDDTITVKNHMVYVKVDNGTKKVKMQDVIDYYCRYGGTRGFSASYRTLGTISGDWRPIDNIAKDCLDMYQVINIKKLRRLAKKAGLTPNF